MRWSRLASLSLAVALVGPVAAHSSVPAAPDGLRGLPNVAITYYEVLGTDITSLNRAVKEHAGPTGKRAASTDWTLAVRFDKRRTGEQCVIADATIEFSAKAALPRLANEQAVPPAVLAAWRKYLAALESESSAKLHFVYERTDEIEQAFEGKSCEQAGWMAAGRLPSWSRITRHSSRARKHRPWP